jgi:hypothetical protein
MVIVEFGVLPRKTRPDKTPRAWGTTKSTCKVGLGCVVERFDEPDLHGLNGLGVSLCEPERRIGSSRRSF